MTGPGAFTERFHRPLGRGDDYGAIVVDHRMDDVDARLRRFFDELLTDGTPHMRLDRLVDMSCSDRPTTPTPSRSTAPVSSNSPNLLRPRPGAKAS